MIKTSKMLQEELSEYKDPKNKISRLERDGKIIRFARGLYETDPNVDPEMLAASIYGPSYISFERALSHYELIPESVPVITSATFEKRKKKRYDTPFGVYVFRDVPVKAFPWDIELRRAGDYACRIASPEKALCDLIYTKTPVGNYKDLEELLFEDMRIDPYSFQALDIDDVEKLSGFYGSRNVKKLAAYMRKQKRNE